MPSPALPGASTIKPALADEARDYLRLARADNTVRAYRADWADFRQWCDGQQRPPLPATPETVALYLAERARTHKASTLTRRLSAISQAHQTAGHAPPTQHITVRKVMAGIRRAKGTAVNAKVPVLTRQLRAWSRSLPDTTAGHRDRALLLLGFAGAFRRSELVSLDVESLQETPEGLVVTIRRSKTDQEAAGRRVGIPHGSQRETCPVQAVRQWIDKAGLATGPLFRAVMRDGQVQPARLSDRSVALIVKRHAAKHGLDPERFAGHSLRAGLATAAAAAGVGERAIMAQTGHRSVTVVRRYIREGSLFRENAAAKVGL